MKMCSSDRPARDSERFSPVFARTLLPGCSRVPFAERNMSLRRRPSTATARMPGVVTIAFAIWRRALRRRFARRGCNFAIREPPAALGVFDDGGRRRLVGHVVSGAA